MVIIHISAKPLSDALDDFALQAGLSIGDSGLDFRNAAGNPVDGSFTQTEALKRLLSGTQFDFDFLDGTTVRIRKRGVAAPRRSAAPFAIENVIVTAAKRSELAETAPYSVAVIGGNEIQALGVQSPHGLTSEVAGLTATNLGPGEDKLFVRGLTDSVLPGLSEAVVGLYLDESRIAGDMPDPDIKLVDIDRVEVLRGPQGSLYGAGSLTGLVRIVTRQPVFDEEQMMAAAGFSVTHGGGVSENFQAMLNEPIVANELALRVAGYFDEDSGYIDELRLGRANTNRVHDAGLRATLGWSPDGRWSVAASVTWQNINADDSQYYDQTLRPLNRDNYLLEPHSDHFLLGSVTANASLDWADLVSNTSFLDRRYANRFDATLGWPQLTGFPLAPSAFDYSRAVRSITHETRLASAGEEPWQWLLGIYLSHSDEDFQSSLSGLDGSGAAIEARDETREDRTSEAALFGQVAYNFARDWSVSAGARAFDAAHEVSARTAGMLAPPPNSFSGSKGQKGIAPQFILTFRPNDDTTLYAQYSEGYRLGGINVDGPQGATGESEPGFDSDVLRNYELGAKLRLFGGRLVANSALYYAQWSNVQTDQIANDGALYILNAGDVHDLGAELDVTARILSGLTASGNVFWNNAGLSHTNPLLAAAEGGLPGAPDFSFGASLRYETPLFNVVDGFVVLDYSYVGTSNLGFGENTPAMGGYHILNIHMGVNRGEWQLVLFADNLTNDDGNTFAFGNPFSAGLEPQITPPQPRTIGLSLTWAR